VDLREIKVHKQNIGWKRIKTGTVLYLKILFYSSNIRTKKIFFPWNIRAAALYFVCLFAFSQLLQHLWCIVPKVYFSYVFLPLLLSFM